MANQNSCVLKEFKYLFQTGGKDVINENGNKGIPIELFAQIESFVLENRKEETTEIDDFLFLTSVRNVGKVLKAKNYVGVLQLKNGFTIEILPKIYEDNEDNENTRYEKTRRIFIKMLRTLRNTPFKHFNLANLRSAKMPLFEIFINMFLDELTKLVRKGIKSAYLLQIKNSAFLKGKLKINEHIRRNYINKHKFYIEYDEYLPDRPENRLIKSTLLYLSKISKSPQTQKRLLKFIFIFDEIEESDNIDNDFSKCKNNRLLAYYEQTLNWCRIFLKKESFTNYKGKSIAFALLFPMEKIFESYVAYLLRKKYPEWEIKTQKSEKYLIEYPKKFALIPDIIMRIKNQTIILDAKWKMLNNEEKKNFGISQADLYQMFAYGKKYKVEKMYLLYPKNNDFKEKKLFKYYDEQNNKKLELTLFPVILDDKVEDKNKVPEINS